MARAIAGLEFVRDDGETLQILVREGDGSFGLSSSYDTAVEIIIELSPDEWRQVIPLIEGMIDLKDKSKGKGK